MRAFIAVDAPSSSEGSSNNSGLADLQREMMQSMDRRDVRPVDPGNFHFTLIFLGEVSEQQAQQVKELLAQVRFEPFTITYAGVGAFPNPRNARVVWVGVEPEGAQKLQALAADVVAKMAQAGFVPDKPFSPHLTIFRAKNRHVRVNVEKYAGRTFGSGVVDGVHLKKSDLGPSGPQYSNIYTVRAATTGEKEGKQQHP